MARKLPPDFDPDRYRAEHPDVALSGLTPAEHYLLFGTIMGRRLAPPPKPAAASETAKPMPQSKTNQSVEATAETNRKAATKASKPIIDRPADLEPAQAMVRPAPRNAGADKDGSISLEALAKGDEKKSAGLAAYGRMFSPEEGDVDLVTGAALLVDGAARIENAWLTADGILRLMVADHGGQADGWTIRAYQADFADPARLQLLAPGALLPHRGPVLVEFELRNSLMPLLLELADASGAVEELALMPFPSLLPGGLHNSELRVLQNSSNPMLAFWSLSDLLLRELGGGAKLSIGRITYSAPAVTDAAVAQWLDALFGFRASGDGQSLERSGDGAELRLPPDCIATISSVVARVPLGSGTSPYLVADRDSLRPRWSAVLPRSWAAAGGPVLDGPDSDEAPRVHVAIALRPLPAPTYAPPSARKRQPVRKLSVLLDASDPDRSKEAVAALRSAIGKDLDLHVRVRGDDSAFRAVLDGDWKAVHADLQSVASEARHGLLLTISDQVDLGDGSVLGALVDMLGDDEVASASCVLLREVSLKKQKVLQPATGGLFPTGISLAVAPSLTFAEPDVLQALPDADYPVVANTLQLTLWRTSAITDLPPPPRPLPATAEDISIGLALIGRGFTSLCTTRVSARLNGDYTPRDAIDPVGQAQLAPQDWQRLLGQVTLLRQLF